MFLGLFFVLGKFAWKPLLEALHHREEHLEHVLHETERPDESEQLLAEYKKRLDEAEDQVRALIEEGRKNALAVAEEIHQNAAAAAQAEKERAARHRNGQGQGALGNLVADGRPRGAVAGKVLGKSLTADDQRRAGRQRGRRIASGPERGRGARMTAAAASGGQCRLRSMRNRRRWPRPTPTPWSTPPSRPATPTRCSTNSTPSATSSPASSRRSPS